jgi:hypothetical protein
MDQNTLVRRRLNRQDARRLGQTPSWRISCAREEAHAYPTDFGAMPADGIGQLSLRGEQLCLARAYLSELVRD